MATGAGRGRGRRTVGRGSTILPQSVTWPGSFGPTYYDPPLEQFPIEEMSDFSRENPLRGYDDRKEEWPKCSHGDNCVVQMFDGGIDGGRRFFRCPRGLNFLDNDNCHFTKWVDPPTLHPTQDYIHYLQNRIFDLEQEVQAIPTPREENEWVISIEDDPICPDLWCKCPYHYKKGAPPPTGSAGAGYYEGGSSQYSLSQFD